MEDILTLVNSGQIREAGEKLNKGRLNTVQNLSFLIQNLLKEKKHSLTSKVFEEFSIKDYNLLGLFVRALLIDSQFQLAIKWSLLLGETRPNCQDCIQTAIRKDCIEVALKNIAELNLEQTFPPELLLEKLFFQENFPGVKKYASRFNLESKYPPERMLEAMFKAGDWDNALLTINNTPKLKSTFTTPIFLEKIVQSNDWMSVLKFINQFGIPMSSSQQVPLNLTNRNIIRNFILAMIKNGKLHLAMRKIFDYSDLQNEFDPKELIKMMIKENQYASALTFIRCLKLEDEFNKELIKINKERIRQLIEFRQLMSTRRRKLSKKAQLPLEQMTVVGNFFLGSRKFVQKPDGRRVLLSLIMSTTGTPTKDNESNTNDDEEEEEIMFIKKPQEKPSSINAATTYAATKNTFQPQQQFIPPISPFQNPVSISPLLATFQQTHHHLPGHMALPPQRNLPQNFPPNTSFMPPPPMIRQQHGAQVMTMIAPQQVQKVSIQQQQETEHRHEQQQERKQQHSEATSSKKTNNKKMLMPSQLC